MINVMIAEDQAIVRNGLKMIIEQDADILVAAEAENGKEALCLLETVPAIDLILMDVRMPVMDGLEATKQIRGRYPHIKILILTTFNDEEYAIKAFREGANGFLLKNADSAALINSIKSCLAGGMSIHADVAAKVMPKLLKETRPYMQTDLIDTLTEREIEVVKHVGLGKTNKEIAGNMFLSVGTVKNHLTQILQKLELRDRTQLAIFAVKNDLI
ncbi:MULTISPECIES: response regulator transcription factor [Bacillaceae]|uniref:response regulator transcription factor n=1 Tax=Bacillaceae TaxID=186817 RepID=UPI001E3313C4|nr:MULTISPECIES: response regulator transcription factor [Bacillaceae]MCE4050413.1 response regulator transcription factor [Bacillus sp. Au-Bac7]MCM3030433.1 response regulator transcription factor [Niallia sp. MER 6]MDL0434643.1 response regulator transcription factor [Niallia sp. SS-2023]UPO88395.1 response regulator transcription factor [Niallia sp. Man26]